MLALSSMESSLVRASRFLSPVLRHDPGRFGLSLGEGGWVGVDDLLAASRRAGIPLDRATLNRVVAGNDKRRFALGPGGTCIRASRGHSVPVDLWLALLEPPEVLYHGTAACAVLSIMGHGIQAGKRVHVHLSSDEQTAEAVGRGHGRPVVLRVMSGRMYRAGHAFYQSANGVWLTETVPASYIQSQGRASDEARPGPRV